MPNPLRRLIDNATFAPFRTVVFRNLWLATFAANIAMWMNDVTAAWVMTSLTTSPVMVALVQTASTLPVSLLGLPSGARADTSDRRRYFAVTHRWVALNALLLATLSLTGTLTAPLLLALTFANGIGPPCAGRCSRPSCRGRSARAPGFGDGAERHLDEPVARGRPGGRGRDHLGGGQRRGVRVNVVLAAAASSPSCAGARRRAPARCPANASSARCASAGSM